jgi:hypothetical protein
MPYNFKVDQNISFTHHHLSVGDKWEKLKHLKSTNFLIFTQKMENTLMRNMNEALFEHEILVG